MILKEIQIKNFRSIKDEKVVFNHNCLILLGKNEAGKSNVLKAIAAVFDEYEVTDKDKRKRIDNEKISQDDYYIRAVFKLQNSDFIKIENNFKKKFIGSELVKFKSEISLLECIKKVFYDFIVKVKIGDGNYSNYSYWNPNPLIKKEIELLNPLMLNETTISYEVGNKFDLINTLYDLVKELYIDNIYRCHYWNYSDDYLLPNTIDINTFISMPENFKALENIFHLCGRDNIKEEFENAKSEDGDYSNLLEQVSKKATSTFQKIWKDFKDTSIQLLPNGNEILVKVVNKAKYSFEDRSDGFKKFISILLMLSTQSRANKIDERDIILIDEPDQSLYPTSAMYLKDELIEISKKSKVVFSTHSQYMIDSTCLDRHRIVEKKDDLTTLRIEDNNAPYSKDELLRQAIGSSIFECLQPVNIIFEGWLDKELFNKHLVFNKKTKEFENFGITYLGGISGAESLVSLLLLANKKFVVVADSDETSKNKRIDFQKNYPQFKDNWIGYADLSSSHSTMEDFFNIEYITEKISEHNSEYIYDEKKDAINNIDRAVSKDKERKQLIKNSLIKDLKKDHIKQEYESLVELIKNKVISL